MAEQTSIKHYSLLKTLTKPLSNLGVTCFSYQYVSGKGEWYTLCSNPDWALYCAQNEVHKHDSALLSPSKVTAGIFFMENNQNKDYHKTIVNPAAEKFNLGRCLVIAVPLIQGIEYYVFAGDKKNHQLLSNYLNNMALFGKQFPHFVRQNIRSIHQQCLDASIDLVAIENPVFLNSTDQFFSTKNHPDMKEFKALFADHPLVEARMFYEINSVTVCFTPREAECINMILAGFTSAKEIARELNLSNRTVNEYLSNIRMKTGSRNTLDCIKSICLALGG